MTEYVIYWWSPITGCEYEEFESLRAARAALKIWRKDYPWNTYYLAQILQTARATKKYPSPTITLSDGTITTVVK